MGLSAGKALASRGSAARPRQHLEGTSFPRSPAGASPPLGHFPFHGLVVRSHRRLVRSSPEDRSDRAHARRRAGEAFEKSRAARARLPGGPIVDRVAARGNGNRYPLPIGRPGDGSNDFSFSGLKTAMIRELGKRGVTGSPRDPDSLDPDLVDLLASFQRSIVSALLERVEAVHRADGIRVLALSGGVAANSELRRTLTEWGEASRVRSPPRAGLHDRNAAMTRGGPPALPSRGGAASRRRARALALALGSNGISAS